MPSRIPSSLPKYHTTQPTVMRRSTFRIALGKCKRESSSMTSLITISLLSSNTWRTSRQTGNSTNSSYPQSRRAGSLRNYSTFRLSSSITNTKTALNTLHPSIISLRLTAEGRRQASKTVSHSSNKRAQPFTDTPLTSRSTLRKN